MEDNKYFYDEPKPEDPGTNGFHYGETEKSETPKEPNNGTILSITSLICGILGLISIGFCCFPFSVCALIFGIAATKGDRKRSPIAFTGMITGILGIIFGAFITFMLAISNFI